MILSYLESMAQVGLAMAFGYTFGLGDLLSGRLTTVKHRWFPGADLALGVAAGALAIAMLWLSLGGVHAFWLVAIGTWALAGRLFTVGKLLMAGVLAGYFAWWGVTADNLDAPALAYFALAFPILTAAFAIAARAKTPTRWRALLGGKPSWPAFIVVFGYLAFFELDFSLLGVVWAFHSGTATVADEKHRAKLVSWGVRTR